MYDVANHKHAFETIDEVVEENYSFDIGLFKLVVMLLPAGCVASTLSLFIELLLCNMHKPKRLVRLKRRRLMHVNGMSRFPVIQHKSKGLMHTDKARLPWYCTQ